MNILAAAAMLIALNPVQPLPAPQPDTDVKDLPVPRLQYFPPKDPSKAKGAVIVCPGGGYKNRARHEADPIAKRFSEDDIHAFVLEYRVSPNRHPIPLTDAANAIAYVRKNAAHYGIEPDKIAILGFSAGGHLAASSGVLFEEAQPLLDPAVKDVSCRPDAMILSYAVLNQHTGSFRNLYGPDAGEEARAHFQLDRHVTEKTPPAFLWHTVEDKIVNIDNAYDFARALRKNGVPYELHAFPHGPHGLGLASHRSKGEVDKYQGLRMWPKLATTWLKQQGW